MEEMLSEKFYHHLDVIVTAAKTQKKDILRITRMEHKSYQPVKERRKTLRTIKKGHLDLESQKKQLGYNAGDFDIVYSSCNCLKLKK